MRSNQSQHGSEHVSVQSTFSGLAHPVTLMHNRSRLFILPPLMAWSLVTLAILRLIDWFPCDTACQGGGHYQRLGPLSLMVPALGAYLMLAVLTTRDARRGGWCAWTVRLAWFLGGGSLFFFAISEALGIVCPFCILCHSLTLGVLFFLYPFPSGVRWWQAVSWLITGVLVFNAAFHHTPVADVAPATAPATAVPAIASSEEANRGRSYGVSSAPYTLEIIIDITCRHCAELYRPLMEALKPKIAAQRVQVIVRHLVRPSQAASQPATELIFAAATFGEHATAMDVLLGSNPEAGLAGMKARLGEVLDAKKLDAALLSQGPAIATLIAADQLRISQLGMGPRTPSAVLSNHGRVTQRWSADLPVTAIVGSLDGGL